MNSMCNLYEVNESRVASLGTPIIFVYMKPKDTFSGCQSDADSHKKIGSSNMEQNEWDTPVPILSYFLTTL